MGEMDRVTRKYMSDNRVFADAVNFYFYGGEQRVDPERLRELDPSQIASFRKKGKARSMERRRDVLKYLAGKQDEDGVILLLGIENQTRIDYSMPVRNMLYDALQYEQQIEQILRGRENENRTLPNQTEVSENDRTNPFFLSLTEEDRLIPVTTLVVYYGADAWKGHRDLHSMLRLTPGSDRIVDNYHLNLICPSEIEDTDFDRFQTGLGKALKICKYSKDPQKLKNVVDSDPVYRSLDRSTARLIQTVVDRRILIPKTRRNVDMCEAVDGLIALGIEQGEERKENEIFENICNLVKNKMLTLAQAAACLRMTEEEFAAKAGL